MAGLATGTRMRALALTGAALVTLVAGFDAWAQWTGVWTLRPVAQSPSGQPHARTWTEMIFDPVAGKPALFGGSGGTYRNDILHLDLPNLRWLDIEPQVHNVQSPYGPPCPRDEHTLAYDPVNALYWTFGGSGYTCGQRNGTTGAGTTTTQIVDPTLPSTVVNFYKDYWYTVTTTIIYRGRITAYNPVTKTLTLDAAVPPLQPGRAYAIGSQAGGGTWNYSPATRAWRGFDAPSLGYTGPKPASRLSPTLAYSGADRALVMFGGGVYNDTWVIDADTKTWIQMIPDGRTTSPFRRAQMINAMAYDPVNDLFVMFGGRCGEGSGCSGVPYNGALGDTWVYRLSTNAWTKMSPPQSPLARQQHSLTYDPVHRVMVLFGGYQGALRFEDTWVYDVTTDTWSQVATTGTPGPRYLHMMVYDPPSAEHVVYGGFSPAATGLASVYSLRLAQGTGNQPPFASFTVTPSTVTLGTPMAFNASASMDNDGSIVTYGWDFGDGTLGSGVTASRTYAAPGTYTARLTVTDNGGLSSSTTRIATVNPASPPSDILYTKKVTGVVTNGGSVTSAVANGSAVPFTNLAGGAYEVTLTVSTPTSLTLVITVSGPGGTKTETVVVSVP